MAKDGKYLVFHGNGVEDDQLGFPPGTIMAENDFEQYRRSLLVFGTAVAFIKDGVATFKPLSDVLDHAQPPQKPRKPARPT